MVASIGGTIPLVPNIKIMEDFCSQTYLGTKRVSYYIVGVDYL